MIAEPGSPQLNLDLLWSAEKLHEQLGRADLAIVDTRQAEHFAAGRIPGCPALRSLLRQLRRHRPRAARIVHAHVGEHAGMARREAQRHHRVLRRLHRHVRGALFLVCRVPRAPPRACARRRDRRRGARPGLRLCAMGRRRRPASSRSRRCRIGLPAMRSVLRAIDDPDSVILDNRSAAEFTGEDRRAKHGGAVPNARHCDWEELFDHATGRMKPLDRAARDLRAARRHAGQGHRRLLQHRLPLRSRLPRAAAAELSAGAELRRLLAGMGQPRRTADRAAWVASSGAHRSAEHAAGFLRGRTN